MLYVGKKAKRNSLTGTRDPSAPEPTPVQNLPTRSKALNAEDVTVYCAINISSHPSRLTRPDTRRVARLPIRFEDTPPSIEPGMPPTARRA